MLGITVRRQPLDHQVGRLGQTYLPPTLPFPFTAGLVGPTADGKWEKAAQETRAKLSERTPKLPATTPEQLVAPKVLSQGFTGHKKGCRPVPPHTRPFISLYVPGPLRANFPPRIGQYLLQGDAVLQLFISARRRWHS